MKRRLPSEWEPQSAIQFTFPHAGTDWASSLGEVTACFVEIIRQVCRRQKALVVCEDAVTVKALLPDLPPDRLILYELPSNDTWARDHGGITIFEGDEPVMLDFMFNGWGLKFPADKDNLITQHLYQRNVFNIKTLRKGGIVLEGGGIESDGAGTLLTTSECLLSPNRNPHLTKAEITAHLQTLFGLDRVLWLDHGHLAGDDTDAHIDTLARFCDEKTIAYVKCEDQDDEHFLALDQMEKELQAFRTGRGEPYRLASLPMPDACFDQKGNRLPATYANFLIINGAVLAPTYGVAQDKAALATLQTCFPNREIVGIDCRPLILQHGSLHCITMQYPAGVV